MVKSLRDLCLDSLCHHFSDYSSRRLDLPPGIAQRLLHRLIDHDYLNSQCLPAITYNLLSPRLTRFEVYGSKLLDDSFLYHLGRACTSLTHIRLNRCSNITDDGLADLLANQNRLEHLELRWMPTIDGRCLTRFCTKKDGAGGDAAASPVSPYFLESLLLKGCANISPEHLCSCVQRNRSVRRLDLYGLRKVTGEWVRKLAMALGDNLVDLNLSECVNMDDEGLHALAEHCKELRRLALMECMSVTEGALRALLLYCKKLENIDFAFCRRWGTALTYDVFEDIPSTITSLSLAGIQAEFTMDEFVAGLAGLPHLIHLILSGFGLLNDACLEKTLSTIGSRLETLELNGSFERLSDVGLESVSDHCVLLRNLGLGLLTSITGRSLTPLFLDQDRARRIESLLLPNCHDLDDTVLLSIAENCCNLRVLDVSGIRRVNDRFLSTLAEYSSSNIRRFFAKANPPLTDQSVCAFATKATNLQCLCLSGNPNLSDRSILALASHCHELQELYLSGCAVISVSSIRYLQDRCTGRLVVYHLVPTTDPHSPTVVAKNLDTGEYVRL